MGNPSKVGTTRTITTAHGKWSDGDVGRTLSSARRRSQLSHTKKIGVAPELVLRLAGSTRAAGAPGFLGRRRSLPITDPDLQVRHDKLFSDDDHGIDLGFRQAGAVQCPLQSAKSVCTKRVYAVQLHCTAILVAAALGEWFRDRRRDAASRDAGPPRRQNTQSATYVAWLASTNIRSPCSCTVLFRAVPRSRSDVETRR